MLSKIGGSDAAVTDAETRKVLMWWIHNSVTNSDVIDLLTGKPVGTFAVYHRDNKGTNYPYEYQYGLRVVTAKNGIVSYTMSDTKLYNKDLLKDPLNKVYGPAAIIAHLR